LDSILAEIEEYKNQYAKLDEEFQRVRDIHSSYCLHLGENSNIIEKLRKYGLSSIDEFVNEVNQLENNVKDHLARFDSIIKEVLAEQQKIIETIQRLQKKQ
jgi:chromosome segregation ATPase